jgi:hypothetical protein
MNRTRMLRRLAPTLAFSCGLVAIIIVIGPRDLESYDTAIFSLDRGTGMHAADVLGHPLYTLSSGLGLRLPLHGSLGASPAAALSPYVPTPFTYALLLVWAIASAVMVVRHALEPLCGRVVTWWAVALLFCSLPVVTYTIANDWPEIAVTYVALVACVFAPHALLGARDVQRSSAERRVAWLSIAVAVWSLVAVSHSGYWPHIAATLMCAAGLVMFRSDHSPGVRLASVATLALVSIVPVALQLPDILRELHLAGSQGMRRFVQGPVGSLLSANLFPWGQVDARMPFTNLILAIVSLVAGWVWADTRGRRLGIGSAIVSLVLGLAATTLSPGSAVYAPSHTWAIRDYAAAFAVLSAACAAAAVLRSPARPRLLGAMLMLVALALASLQCLAYAGSLVIQQVAAGGDSGWTRDLSSPEERLRMRGFAPGRVVPGERLALWTGTRARMRNDRSAAADFADSGFALVTADTKDRTMRGVVEPNRLLFNQSTDLAPEILCDVRAVQFLQLRYLLTPHGVACPSGVESRGPPWQPIPGVLVDGWLDVHVTPERDSKVRALPVADVTKPFAREPALSAGSSLLPALVPLSGTSLRIGPRDVVVTQEDAAQSKGRALVLPVAYDSAWRPSNGRIENVGGLLSVVDVDQRRVTLRFVPDAVAIVLAVAMTIAQLFACIGLLGLAIVGPAEIRDDATVASQGVVGECIRAWTHRVVRAPARRVLAVVMPPLRNPRHLLYLGFSVAVVQRFVWHQRDAAALLAAVALPTTAIVVGRVTRSESLRNWIGGAVLAAALVRIGIGGSRAAEALHDPLFWGVATVVAVVVSAVIGRWPVPAAIMSALAGGTAVVATLLPNLQNFAAAFPHLDLAAVGGSLTMMSSELGVVATACLLGLCLDAIALHWRATGVGRVCAAVRGALLAGLVLGLAGAMPMPLVAGLPMVMLGGLLGLVPSRA